MTYCNSCKKWVERDIKDSGQSQLGFANVEVKTKICQQCNGEIK